MKRFLFAEVAVKASSESTRDRFAAMAARNQMDPYKAASVLAGIEGWSKGRHAPGD